MREPPRARDARLFGRDDMAAALLQGGAAMVLLAAGYGLALYLLPEPQARGAGFAALVAAALSLLHANRRTGLHSPAANPLFPAIATAALGALLLLLYVPPAAALFKLAAPPAGALAAAACAGLAVLPCARIALQALRPA